MSTRTQKSQSSRCTTCLLKQTTAKSTQDSFCKLRISCDFSSLVFHLQNILIHPSSIISFTSYWNVERFHVYDLCLSPLAHSAAQYCLWNLGLFRNPAQGRTKYSLWNLGTFRNPAQDRAHQHSGTWDHSEIRPRTEQSTHSGTWDYSEIRPRTELMQPPLTLQLTHS